MGSQCLFDVRENIKSCLYFSRKPEKTMHLSWILIGFQILVLSTQIYGKHTSHFRTDLTPSTVLQRHFTLYETENDAVSTSNGFFKNLDWFKKTVTNAISTGISRIESRQDIGSFFMAIFISGIFPLLGIIAIQLQESLSSSPKRFPVDCVFNPWGPCSRSCGGGTQTRDVLQVDKDGGLPCVGPTLSHCNPEACPPVGT